MPEIVILAKGGSMHHTGPMVEHFGARCLVENDWHIDKIVAHKPEIVITFDEHGAELGLCIAQANRMGFATLQIMDGILEWRRTWAYPTSPEKRPINQPALSHKVACLGRADARIMESWGNVGKCEVVGSPRLDGLIMLAKGMGTEPVKTRPMRLLIMTAKTPGFTPSQVETTFRSLLDLKETLAQRSDIEVLWRVTQNLHDRLGVANTVKDVLSNELHDILRQVDAVITTPSTTMLESMLCGVPVALLDYHNCPHYIPAAWRITCKAQISPVLEDLKSAPLDRMLYQDYCLHDALSCRTPALPRMIRLIEEMLRIRREQKAAGIDGIAFPHRILDIPEEHVSWPAKTFDLERLYPHHKVFGRRDITVMQAELEASLGVIEQLKKQVHILTGRLHRIPGYRLTAFLWKKLKNRI